MNRSPRSGAVVTAIVGLLVSTGPAYSASYGEAKRLVRAEAWPEAVTELRALLREPQPYGRMAELRGLLDAAVWGEAEAARTVAAVDAYLAEFPQGTRATDARRLGCRLRDKGARSPGTEVALARFATDHPDCLEAEAAWEEAATLAAASAIDSGDSEQMLAAARRYAGLDALFQRAAAVDVEVALGWVETHTGTPQAEAARGELEARAWEAAASGGLQALDEYHRLFPGGPHASDVEALRRPRLRGVFRDDAGVLVPLEQWAGPDEQLFLATEAPLDVVELTPLGPDGEVTRFADDERAVLRSLGWDEDLLAPWRLRAAGVSPASVLPLVAARDASAVRVVGRRGDALVMEAVLPVTVPTDEPDLLDRLRAAANGDLPASIVAEEIEASTGVALAKPARLACRQPALLAVYTADPRYRPGTSGALFQPVARPDRACAGRASSLRAGGQMVGVLTLGAPGPGGWPATVEVRPEVPADTVMDAWLWTAVGDLVPLVAHRLDAPERPAREARALLEGVAALGPEANGVRLGAVDLDGVGAPEIVGTTSTETRVFARAGDEWRSTAVPGKLLALFADGTTGRCGLLVVESATGARRLQLVSWVAGEARVVGAVGVD